MNPLRVLADWLLGHTTPPALTEHEQLMRHTGRPECHIPDHTDALRRLGRMTIERDQWKTRALRAETMLRHPASQEDRAA